MLLIFSLSPLHPIRSVGPYHRHGIIAPLVLMPLSVIFFFKKVLLVVLLVFLYISDNNKDDFLLLC